MRTGIGRLTPCTCCSPFSPRRRLLLRSVLATASAGLSAASLSFASRAAIAQPAKPGSSLIDVHFHYYPPAYLKENLDRVVADIGTAPAGFYRKWTPELALAQMDAAGIQTAIGSITSPGVWFNDGLKARTRARDANVYAATLMSAHPTRFGMFVAIPLPDIEGSLNEIEYGLDTLKFDGVNILTSYSGKLISDPAFAPVFEELNRRSCVVFVHPTMSSPHTLAPGVYPPIIEFPTDTARALTSMLIEGTFTTYKNIRFIFSHGGGTLPSIVQRVDLLLNRLSPEERERRVPGGAIATLRRQFFDIASVAENSAGMAAVLQLYTPNQILLGTDSPFGSSKKTVEAFNNLGLSDETLQTIGRGNAVKLFPRFRSVVA